jgi:hypothetical protein
MIAILFLAAAPAALPGPDTEDVWAGLDAEVEALTTTLAEGAQSGPKLGGFISALWTESGDFHTGGEDTSGASVPDARVKLSGERAGYTYRIQYDLADSTFLDGFVEFPLGAATARVGQFKSPVMHAGLLSAQKLAFVTRSVIGAEFTRRQPGVEVYGAFEALHWFLGVQNGVDGVADEHLVSARAAYDFAGGGMIDGEGAYGGKEEVGGTASVAVIDDGAVQDGTSLGFEVYAGTSIYSFSLQYIDFDETAASARGVLPGAGLGVRRAEADTSPLVLTGTYMIEPGKWEGAVRLQDLDDVNDTSVIDLNVNHFIDGHNLKWSFQYSMWDSDAGGSDGDMFLIQALIGF